MTAYTLNSSVNWDQLHTVAAISGSAHTFTINAATLTIDTDTRYGGQFTASTGTIGNITISTTLGGSVVINAQNVRLIPYNSGATGNVPSYGTTISQGGVSATLIGVWGALNSAPTAAGAAMPSSGFIKVKNKTGGDFATGALTGIGATASAADVPGWIEVAGIDGGAVTVPRLGSFSCTGNWFSPIDTAGAAITTSGSANQTIQLPGSLANTYYGGVWIETGVGTNSYEFYASAANITNTGAGTDAVRGKIVWISSQGLCRIGSDGTNTVGFVPPAGCRIRVPNILLLNTTSGSPTTNAVPNATLASRYRFISSLGNFSIDRVAASWNCIFSPVFALLLSNSAILNQLLIGPVSTFATISNVVVGMFDNAFTSAGLSITNSSNANFTDFYSAGLGNQITFNSCTNLSFTNTKVVSLIPRASALSLINVTTNTFLKNTTFNNLTVINGRINLPICSNITLNNSTYCDVLGGTTGTTNANNFLSLTGSTNVRVNGLTFGGVNLHPYDFVCSISSSSDIEVRNIGSPANGLLLGSSNPSAGFISAASSFNISVKRCYVYNFPRTRLVNSAPGVSPFLIENLWADASTQIATGSSQTSSSAIIKGCYGNSSPANSFTSVSDTIFWDAFTGNTTGQIGLYFNEATALGYAAFVTLTGTAVFLGTGSLYIPNSGDTATFEFPYWILGYTSLANIAPTLTGGTGVSGRVTIEYQLNKNGGTGWTVYKAATGANLSGEGAVSPTNGFKLRIRFTCTSTDTMNNAITGYQIQGVTNVTDQRTTYPLNNYPISVSGLSTAANTAIRFVSGLTLLTSGLSDGSGVFSATYATDTDYTIPVSVRIRSRKIGVYPIQLEDQISNSGISAIASFSLNPFSTASGASVTGVAIALTSGQVSGITISQTRTFGEIVDYCWNYLVDNLTVDPFLTYDGIIFAPTCNFTIASGGIINGSQTLSVGDGRTLTLAVARVYNFQVATASTSTIVVASGNTQIKGTLTSGTTINVSSGSATVTLDSIVGIVAGSGVTLKTPDILVSAPNFVDGTRVQISHRQIFTISSTAINTTADTITLGNDSNGDAANFRTSSPNTLVRFQLTSGATIPTSTPQISDGGLYYWRSGNQLSLTEGGTAINFTTQGSGNFTLIAETEINNSVVSGVAGYSVAIIRPNNARIRVKAIHWSSSAGIASCSQFYDQVFAWSTTAGISILDTVNNAVASSQDTIHQQLVSISSIQLEGAVIDSTGASITSVTLPDDGSTVSGLAIALEGTGKVQINANDNNGFITWQELYLWGCYIRSTEAGIRLSSANTLFSASIYNYTFNNLEIDNISFIALQVVGGIGRSADGSSLVSSTTTGPVILNAVSQGTGAIVTTGGSALTPTESTRLQELHATLQASGVFSTASLVNAPSGGGGSSDWTATERNQIRFRLGLDGTVAAPIATPDLVRSNQLPANFGVLGINGSGHLSRVTLVDTTTTNADMLSATAVWGATTRTLSSGVNIILPNSQTFSTSGSVGSISGVTFPSNFGSLAIANMTGAVTVGTNNDKSGYSLSGTQSFNLTGNITGNLSGSVGSVTSAIALPTIPNNWITAAGIATDAIDGDAIAASAVTEIQSGLATSSAVAAIPTNPLLTTDSRLNNLDAAISSRLATASYTAPPSVANIWGAVTSGLTGVGTIGKLLADNLDATISSRSTYAGSDTAGTTTLLSRLTSTRAGYLDNLSGGAVMLASSYTAPDNTSILAIKAKTDQLGFTSGNVNAHALAGSISVSSVANDAITAASISATAIAEIQSGLATSAQVTANGFTGSDRTALLSTQSASLAVADGRQKIDYLNSTFTLYNSDGSVRRVFNLRDQDNNAATSAATAVERIPQ